MHKKRQGLTVSLVVLWPILMCILPFQSQRNVLAALFMGESYDHHTADVREMADQPVFLGGGKCLPPGLESENVNWMEQPIIENTVQEDYGEEYKSIELLRKELDNIKKSLTSILAPVESIYRNQERLLTLTNDQDKAATEKLIKDSENKRDQVIEQLEKNLPMFDKHPEYVSYKQGVQEAIALSKTRFNNKEEHFNFGNACKKTTTNIFRDQKNLLEKMKLIKKTKAAAENK
ncbi:hypothetical protein DFA_12059 [Cavenderia fasciculata]|uniref:Uncharacterized protein n=1 Tax=Cavenderia fasciculata TaxID=261658 RepID=F4QFI8_CACFS|nr:uncharacterized protein DFA_12059 [Cavenderia fasciculata]EGG14289.1 hypothetical protein DFA_12059 [Cavenderia fasciculata]|eukprot:XP_004350998.1 hypothetical protein DFA_12059 [Cavenderia fasciculata]